MIGSLVSKLLVVSFFTKLIFCKDVVIRSGLMPSWYKQLKAHKDHNVGSAWDKSKSYYYETHGTGKLSDFWLITTHTKLDGDPPISDLIYIDLEYQIVPKGCYGNDGQVRCYSDLFGVYGYFKEWSSSVPLNNFIFFGNTSKNDDKRHNQTFSFYRNSSDRNSSDQVTFGIRSLGAAGSVYSMTLYYKYCEERFINSTKFKKTFAPQDGALEVFGNCSQNSVPSNNENTLKIYCDKNGDWINTTLGCRCLPGFGINTSKGCTVCKSGYFKANLANSECIRCPRNSLSNKERTGCECKESFYRLNNAGQCYALLDAPDNISQREISRGKINITWLPPESPLEDTIFYDIECYVCELSSCNKTCIGEQYQPTSHNLTQTHVVVDNLRLRTRYMFLLYAKNKLNYLATEDKWKSSRVEYGPFVTDHVHNGRKPQSFTLYYVAGAITVLVVVLLSVLVIILLIKRKNNEKSITLNGFSNLDLSSIRSNQEYIDPSVFEKPEDAVNEFTTEIEPNLITLEMLVGSGEFGDVYKGKMKSPDKKKIPVAIKTLKHDAEPKSVKDFLLEASIMGQFNNPNVVKLHGIVTKPNIRMIVLEYMSNGSLDCFLKNNIDKLTNCQMIGMARGVAAGMKYLSAIKFIHRDLAARNILLNDSLLCKISDFGLSRELDSTQEYSTKGGKIPVRWTAPEAINFRKFSSASDVWSYGILLWEIFSFAERPYWDWDNMMVISQVEQGYRLPAPMKCPKGVHDLMLHCWEEERTDRPTFGKIALIIDKWIRSPETMFETLDYFLPLEIWLESIKMQSYCNNLISAGYEKPLQLATLNDEDLKQLGISLIGHRNKILKNAMSLKHETPYESMDV